MKARLSERKGIPHDRTYIWRPVARDGRAVFLHCRGDWHRADVRDDVMIDRWPHHQADAAKAVSEAICENEGGHMSATHGRLISTPQAEMPYLVILCHEDAVSSKRAFSTVRAAEAFIRRNTPRPAPRVTLWDRPALD